MTRRDGLAWRFLCALLLTATSLTGIVGARVTFAVIATTDLGLLDPTAVVVQDFNQDGHLDVFVTTKLFKGDGTGALTPSGGVFFAQPAGVASADFNADGYPDVVITQDLASKQSTYGDVCGSTIGIALFPGPDFGSARCIATTQRVIAVQTGDFNRDGRAEIAVVSASGSGLWIYSGDYFQPPWEVTITSVPDGHLQASALAPPIDLNGDGNLDLVVSHGTGVTTFLGSATGTFTAGGATTSNATAAVAAGRLNGDHYPDLAWIEAGINGRLLVGYGSASNTFSTQVVAALTTPAPGLQDVAIVDIDHDERQDIVIADKGTGTIRIYFGSGDGSYAADPAAALTVKPRLLATADWDEDGDHDLAILDSGVGGLNALSWMARQTGGGALDATPPVVTLASPSAASTVSGRLAVAATALDNVGVRYVEFYAGTRFIARTAGPNFVVSWDTSTSPNGAVTLTARAFDAALNPSPWSALQVTVSNTTTVDTTPPVLTVPQNTTIEATGPGGATFAYNASALDDVSGSITPTCTPASGSQFHLYATMVTCTATDAHGNGASASFVVNVRDTTPPAITVPDPMYVDGTLDSGIVHYSVTAADIVDGNVIPTCAPPSEQVFPAGTTTISCMAADAHGNARFASFPVTVYSSRPAIAAPVSPAGPVIAATPVFTWSAVAMVRYYVLWITDSSADAPLQLWYTSAQAGCAAGTGTCTVSAPRGLKAGRVIWKVLTWNPVGYGEWSSLVTAVVDIADGSVTAPTPIGPFGSIGTGAPTFVWDAVDGVTWYQLSVTDGIPVVRDFWFTAAEACASAPCAVTPDAVLAPGPASWRIRAWRTTGGGPWSADMSFDASEGVPGRATLVAPSGSIATPMTTFMWNAAHNVRYYLLRVVGSDNTVSDRWYRPVDVGCPVAPGTCSATGSAGIALKAGAAVWSVLTWNAAGYGPWSDRYDLLVEFADPLAVAPAALGPFGTITSTNVPFRWTAVAGTLTYRLAIRNNGGAPEHLWYSPAAASCDVSAECSVIPLIPLVNGMVEWQVQGWTANGYSTWSPVVTLTVTSTAPETPAPMSPVGAAGSNAAVFTWNASPTATYYYVRAYAATGLSIDRWITPEAAGCASVRVCTLDAGMTLPSGSATWQVIAWNPTGYSEWSPNVAFTAP